MEKITFKNFYRNPEFWIRIALVVFLVVLAVILAFVGKEHQFLLDNNTREVNGTTYSSMNLVEVQIDDNKSLEIPRRTRLDNYVTGQRHRITVTYTKGGQEQVLELKFKVPFGERITLINIPALVGGADESIWKEEFIPKQVVTTEEPVVEDDMSMDIEF